MAETAGGAPWPVLDAHERRVLGVLVEKSKTTPDAYPLSVNALTAGCNQKSNRDPPTSLEDVEVEDTLARLQKGGLVMRVTGASSRVERWRHLLYDTWHLDRVDLAILAELLLRGPQTEGELRTRASRMEPFNDLDSLRKALEPLVKRGLVVYLTPLGRRGAGGGEADRAGPRSPSGAGAVNPAFGAATVRERSGCIRSLTVAAPKE